ncbi:MAG: hypothetical protein Q9222_000418 [Ikaeria aurantiellina]
MSEAEWDKATKDKALLKTTVRLVRVSQLGRRLTRMQTDLDDCADSFVAAAKNASMTGQAIVVGKFSANRMATLI